MVDIKSYKIPGLKMGGFSVSRIERDERDARAKGLPSAGYYPCQGSLIIGGGVIGYETIGKAERILAIKIKHILSEQRKDFKNKTNWTLEDIDGFEVEGCRLSKFMKMTKYQKKLALVEESTEKLEFKGISVFAN